MVEVVVGIVVAVTVAGAGLRLSQWWVRRQGRQRLAGAVLVREARVSARILVSGPGLPTFMNKRANRTHSDLLLTADRFLVSTSRGVLFDSQGGRQLSSARCPGPGKLVLEASTPGPKGGVPTSFRLDALIDEPDAWVRALAPFVESPIPR